MVLPSGISGATSITSRQLNTFGKTTNSIEVVGPLADVTVALKRVGRCNGLSLLVFRAPVLN